MVNLIVAFVMFLITIPSTFAATFLVPERPVDEWKALADDGSSVVEDEKVIEQGASAALRRDSL